MYSPFLSRLGVYLDTIETWDNHNNKSDGFEEPGSDLFMQFQRMIFQTCWTVEMNLIYVKIKIQNIWSSS